MSLRTGATAAIADFLLEGGRGYDWFFCLNFSSSSSSCFFFGNVWILVSNKRPDTVGST